MRPQIIQFLSAQPEHEIRREAILIAFDLLVEVLGSYAIKHRKFAVEQNPLAAQNEYRLRDVLDGRNALVPGHPWLLNIGLLAVPAASGRL